MQKIADVTESIKHLEFYNNYRYQFFLETAALVGWR